MRAVLAVGLVASSTATSVAGNVTVKVDVPDPPANPPPLKVKGFLDRIDNPIAKARGYPIAPLIVVALESEPKTDATGQVPWELVGDSFAKPVIGVAAGSEVVIKNVSKTARNLVCVEDAKLVPPGPINPTGPKSFRVTEPKVLTIVDKDAAYLKGTIVVVASPFVGTLDAKGAVDFENVPEGTYKVRVFLRDAWVAEKPVTVPAKGKAEVTIEKTLMAPSNK